jgi:hypothetical protein
LHIGKTRNDIYIYIYTALSITEFVLSSSLFAGTIQQSPQVYVGLRSPTRAEARLN